MATFTGSINDKKEAWLKEKGYSGSLNDMLLKYYNDQAGSTYLSRTDALRNLLEKSGYSGSINDMYSLFLMDNTSVDGSITDMESQFFADSTKSFPLVPTAYLTSLGVKGWYKSDDTPTVTTYAIFTLDNAESTTISIQCKQDIMPLTITFSESDPVGATYNPSTRNMDVTWNISSVDEMVAQINLLSGYTCVRIGNEDQGANSVSRTTPNVAKVDDLSGNGNHAVQATPSQQPSLSSGINGKQTLLFAASKWLKVLSVSTKGNFIFAIFRTSETTYSEWAGVLTARAAPNSNKVSASTNNGGFTGRNGGTEIVNVGQSTVSVYVNGVQGSAANFDNSGVGVSVAPMRSPYSVILTDDIGSNGTQNYAIGADVFDVVGNRHHKGDILEILIADTAPSTIQVAGISAYGRGRGRTA